MTSLPSGTVTFLFTDIEGSTRLWEQHPEAMKHALARHNVLLRAAIETQRGYVFKLIGDAFCAAFHTAPEALCAALQAQRMLQAEPWAETGPLKVRMALHTGVTEQCDGDYIGPALNRLARLLNAGHGGQVLLSAVTQELVRDDLPLGVRLRDMGERRLRDLTRPEHIYQLVAAGLLTDFPALKTLDMRRTNLPIQPTPLIGRADELAYLTALLRGSEVRLLTLTGFGGIGKTRLALQVAAELLDDYPDGIFFVDLAPISDPQSVPARIAQVLELREGEYTSLLETLQEYLRPRRLLLVLDNFEQVVDAAPALAELLAAARGLSTVVTSRVALRLRGEQEHPVPPLKLPERQQLQPLEQLIQYEALRLFIERARAVLPGFDVSNTTASTIAEICQRLNGMPLAIELAAARIRVLEPEQLLQRLGLQLLTGGARDLPARQQTLRSTIDWSYRLLDQAEQHLFVWLGVFVGGCTLEAVEAVTSDLQQFNVLDGLDSLVEKGLLRHEKLTPGGQAESRFVLFETIREYALEQLMARGEEGELRRRHTVYYLALAEQAEQELRRSQQVLWLDRLERERDNMRAALAWAIERDGALALRLAAALGEFWMRRGSRSEAYEQLTRILAAFADEGLPRRAVALLHTSILALASEDPLERRRSVSWAEQSRTLAHRLGDSATEARALSCLGLLALVREGDFERARLLMDAGLTMARALGDIHILGRALHTRGLLAMDAADYATAQMLFAERLLLTEQGHDTSGYAQTLNHLGMLASYTGDRETARELYERAVTIWRRVRDPYSLSFALINRAFEALIEGSLERGEELLEESLQLAERYAWSMGRALANCWLGYVAWHRQDLDRARALLTEALSLSWRITVECPDRTDFELLSQCLIGLAGLVATAEAPQAGQRAARLCGAADAAIRMSKRPAIPLLLREREAIVAALRKQLDVATFEAAWNEGHAMPLEQIIAYALELANAKD